jgi:hypothetical protein
MSHQDFAIFVGNIPPETTEEDMRSAFQSCGVITRVQLPRDHTGKVKGTSETNVFALFECIRIDFVATYNWKL